MTVITSGRRAETFVTPRSTPEVLRSLLAENTVAMLGASALLVCLRRQSLLRLSVELLANAQSLGPQTFPRLRGPWRQTITPRFLTPKVGTP
jgi:hypothetical protein